MPPLRSRLILLRKPVYRLEQQKRLLARRRLLTERKRLMRNRFLVENQLREIAVARNKKYSRPMSNAPVSRNAQPSGVVRTQRRVERKLVSSNIPFKANRPRLGLVRPPIGLGIGLREVRGNQVQGTRNIGHPVRQPNAFVPRVVFPSGQPISRGRVVERQESRMVRLGKPKKLVGDKSSLRLIGVPQPQNRFLQRNGNRVKSLSVRWRETRAKKLGLRVITAPTQHVSGNVRRPALKKPRLRSRLRLVKPFQPATKKTIPIARRERIVPVASIQRMARQVSRTQTTIRRQMESKSVLKTR